MIITRQAMSRRTVLRGIGATLALPLLDAMAPALTAAAQPTKRIAFIYQGAGVVPSAFVPKTAGKNFELSRILEPHAPLKDYLTVVSGTAHAQANSMGEGNGDHQRASAVWLTGVHAYDRKSEVHLATTLDQVIAGHIGNDTRLSSLEMSLDGASSLACDAADCFLSSSISWRSPTQPNPMERQPRVVFERLMGEGATPAERRDLRLRKKSMLDSLAGETGKITKALGPGDRRKMSEYLDSVRDIERRLQNAETASEASVDTPDLPSSIPNDPDVYWGLTIDLLALAYRIDATRVVTLQLTADQSGRTYKNLGISESGHTCSHHRRQSDLVEKRTRILQYHEALQVQLLTKLRDTQDGDGNLLDHSLVISGQGMGDGDLHDHVNLPLWMSGHAGGALPGNKHVAYAPEKQIPQSNLWLTVMDLMGVPTPDKFGDSNGHLTL